jgi:hypothetical protein
VRPRPAGASFLTALLSLKGLLVSLIGLLLIGGVFFASVVHLKNQARWIVRDTLPGLTHAGEANASLGQAFNRTLMFLMIDNADQRSELKKQIESFSRVTTEHLQAYKSQIYSQEDLNRFQEVLKRRLEYMQVRQRTLGLMENHKKQEALNLYQNRLFPAYSRYKEAADKLFEYNIRQGQSRGQAIMIVCTVTQFVVAVVGVGIFLIGFLMGISR